MLEHRFEPAGLRLILPEANPSGSSAAPA